LPLSGSGDENRADERHLPPRATVSAVGFTRTSQTVAFRLVARKVLYRGPRLGRVAVVAVAAGLAHLAPAVSLD